MRSFRRRHHEDEEESAFVSMTDMTVSFLFIVMILLAYFASQFNEQLNQPLVPKAALEKAERQRDEALAEIERLNALIAEKELKISALSAEIVLKDDEIARLKDQISDLEKRVKDLEEILEKSKIRNPLEAYISASDTARRKLVNVLADRVNADIKAAGIEGLNVIVSTQGDALRFQGEGLFRTREQTLEPSARKIIERLGKHLEQELACFTLGPRGKVSVVCNPGLVLIDTLQIEGHTDSDASHDTNLDLSSDRARSAFNVVAAAQGEAPSDMLGFENLLGQPVLAVAGYGETRPIRDNSTREGKAANRRIDLRFIMYVPKGIEYVPQTVDDIDRIRLSLLGPVQP